MVMLMIKIIKAGPKDNLFAPEADDHDFVIAALPVTPATKELGS
jgi:cytochrome d ubiquinol oxidase subunit I